MIPAASQRLVAMACAVAVLGLALLASAAQSPFDTADYSDIIPDPDAYGTVPIPGPRLDRPYPGRWDDGDSDDADESQDSFYPPDAGWQLDLRVQQHIWDDSSLPAKNVTRIAMQLRPPPAGQPGGVLDVSTGDFAVTDEGVTSTWSVVVLSLLNGLDAENALPVVGDGNDDERGSCPTSVLSEDCVRELREGIADYAPVISGAWAQDEYLQAQQRELIPSSGSCGWFKWYWLTRVNMTNEFNLTTIDYTDFREQNGAGEDTGAYDRHAAKTFPTVVIWGHSNTTEQGTRLREDQITVACVKVDSVREGAEMPTGGAAAGLLPGYCGGWLVGIVAVFVAMATELVL